MSIPEISCFTTNSSITNLSLVRQQNNQSITDALYSAIIHGYDGHVEQEVEQLIELKADVNATTNGKTPLQWATQLNRVNIVSILLSRGALVDTPDENGLTPLFLAISIGSVDLVEKLIDHGANIEAVSSLGYTPLLFAHNMYRIVKYRLPNKIKALGYVPHIDQSKDLITQCSVGIFHRVGSFEAPNLTKAVYEKLLTKGVNRELFDLRTKLKSEIVYKARGETPNAREAHSTKEVTKIPFYINKNNIYWECSQSFKITPSILAELSENNREQLIENMGIVYQRILAEKLTCYEILKIARLYTDCTLSSDLMHLFFFSAVRENSPVILSELLKNGMDVNAVEKGHTALHLAVRFDCLETAEILLNGGANPNAEEMPHRRSPLHLATEYNKIEMARLLLKTCYKTNIHAKRSDGQTPLHNASHKIVSLDFLNLYISMGADIFSIDNHGLTPLHVVSWSDNLSGLQEILRHAKSLGQLKECLNSRSEGGNTALMFACDQGHYFCVSELVKACKSVDGGQEVISAVDLKNETALHLAIRADHIPIATLLIESGIDLEIENEEDHDTVLSLATRLISKNCVELLLNFNVNIETKDRTGNTPMNIIDNLKSKYRGNREISSESIEIQGLFYQHGADTSLIKIKTRILNKIESKPTHCKLKDLADADDAAVPFYHTEKIDGNEKLIHFPYLLGGALIDGKIWFLENIELILQRIYIEQLSDLEILEIAYLCKDSILPSNLTTFFFSTFIRTLSFPLFEIYLNKEGVKVTLADYGGDTVLHIATRSGSIQMLQILLEDRYQLNVNAKGIRDRTPLYEAVRIDSKELVDLLISKGADIFSCDSMNFTPLHFASDNNRINSAKAILSHARSLGHLKHCLTAETNLGDTALINACASNNYELAKELFEECNKLDNGQEIIAVVNNEGRNSLFYAIYHDNEPLIVLLLEMKLNVKINIRDHTPLQVAVYNASSKSVTILLNLGADIHAKDTRGYTPLRGINEIIVEIEAAIVDIQNDAFEDDQLSDYTSEFLEQIGSGAEELEYGRDQAKIIQQILASHLTSIENKLIPNS